MVLTTTSLMPPEIQQHFNRDLLGVMLGMMDPKRYRELYGYRFKPGTRKHREYELIMEVYEKLYGWKKAKEAYVNSKNNQGETEKPVVPIEAIHSVRGLLGKILREEFDSQHYWQQWRRDSEVSKVQKARRRHRGTKR
jgi:hypothetical protein